MKGETLMSIIKTRMARYISEEEIREDASHGILIHAGSGMTEIGSNNTPSLGRTKGVVEKVRYFVLMDASEKVLRLHAPKEMDHIFSRLVDGHTYRITYKGSELISADALN